MKSYLFLYLIPAVFAIIEVKISGSFHKNYTIVTSGTDKAVIKDSERLSFNVTDTVIKDCVRDYLGGRPNDVFLHSPTPWGNLYKIYGWSQAYRVLKPVSSRIINVSSSPQMLKQQHFDNIKEKMEISQTIHNRFAVSWIKAPELSVKKIDYQVKLDGFDMAYVNGLGQKGVNITSITIQCLIDGASFDFGVVVIEIYATRVSIKTEIVYQANLWGNVIINYAKAFRGHHFYCPNLADIMQNCGFSNSLVTRQIVEVGYYTDAKVVVKNKTSGLMLLTQNVEIYQA